MRLLLDTHAFVWFALDDPKLSLTAKTSINDPSNEVYLSPASFWELAIKISLGKYRLKQPFKVFVEHQITVNQIRLLPIEIVHAEAILTLPLHLRDPFDRLLIGQAIVESMRIVSDDGVFDNYPVSRLW